MKSLLLLSMVVTIIAAQRDYTTPVPILKQINRHNEDGSYSYGYEAADGTFKIETKYANGEVQGKYGYVDDGGKLREIEYGASNRGFEPQGTDINVPPPTLSNSNYPPLGPNEEDDGQYREDPSIYYKDSRYNTKPAGGNAQYSAPRPAPVAYNPAPQQYYRNTAAAPQPAPAPAPAPAPFSQHRFQAPLQHQQQYYQPAVPQHRADIWHPNAKVDINTGSYSLSYTGR
ncbi:pupal cuticle protein 27 [Anopheles aquasalis]|uniref:pupal cuticle protein 27 n=1 Tax=Anopheles aquasalis TaxID=42839 RepID=UPI00215AEDD1|nr:pupal cuticle protein 27 [Anopheles aquasalis]